LQKLFPALLPFQCCFRPCDNSKTAPCQVSDRSNRDDSQVSVPGIDATARFSAPALLPLTPDTLDRAISVSLNVEV